MKEMKVFMNNILLFKIWSTVKDVKRHISEFTGMEDTDFYLLQNGKILNGTSEIASDENIQCVVRTLGGKGGFGSMLRAIGAQIEKTTNREACRDLSGRRLRDINEEKRLKSWLEKKGDRDREMEERKKKKIEKLLSVPKHEFKDEKYEASREKLTEKVSDAVEEGFSKSAIGQSKCQTSRKRKAVNSANSAKRKKAALWVDDAISDSEGSTDNEQAEKD